MFIETLEDVLDKQQANLQSNLTISRYLKSNLQLSRTDFKSLKMIGSKKKLQSELSPDKQMACTTNSLSTSDSVRIKVPISTLQFQSPVVAMDQQSPLLKDNKPAASSNLLRQTFGNFRIFKSYANTVKSSFQISNEKGEPQAPIVLNFCYQAPVILGRSQKPEKRAYAHSESERPKIFRQKQVEVPSKRMRPQLSQQQTPVATTAEQPTRLPTLESKPSVCSTQPQQKPSTTSIPLLKLPLEVQVKQPKTYLELDPQCFSLLNNNKPLHRGQRFLKCRKIPILSLSAERVCVIDSENLELVYSDSPKDQDALEIASLTKVVTALLSILICQRYGLDYKVFRCRVSDEAAFMPGTSAQLQVGDTLTVQNLLYGLMLPSGNDAAVTLAENLGRVILKNKRKLCKLSPQKVFVNHMNALYRQVVGEDPAAVIDDDSQETIHHLFQNPSGLSLNPNYTKPEQISLFATVAYRNEVLKRVVCQKEYELTIRNDRYGLERKMSWKNTNKLLWKGWEGIKTGTTDNAGPCFLGKHENLVVGIFNCSSQNKRFAEAVSLVEMIRRALT